MSDEEPEVYGLILERRGKVGSDRWEYFLFERFRPGEQSRREYVSDQELQRARVEGQAHAKVIKQHNHLTVWYAKIPRICLQPEEELVAILEESDPLAPKRADELIMKRITSDTDWRGWECTLIEKP